MLGLRNIFPILLCAVAVSIGAYASTFKKFDPCQGNPNCQHAQAPCPSQMPLVKISLPAIHTGEPQAKRDAASRYYLQACVRISVGNSSGSGTICYFDDSTHEAYIISCGHLFSGDKSPGASGTRRANVDVFYKNDVKLSEPETFVAEVICYNQAEDISILKFAPNWPIQRYFPIAPLNYPVHLGMTVESTGCDHATETAAYTVKVAEGMTEGQNLITNDNSPRPGRSGGGLLTSEGYYIGIVWGTSALDGSGYGVHVPLRRIHAYLAQYDDVRFLLTVRPSWSVIHSIPIHRPSGQQDIVPNGYLPTP